jgi:uncharacterized protein (DUF849 family)
LRVGIEDTAGATEMTNAETVKAAVDLANTVGRPIAQGPEAVSTFTRRQIVGAGRSI